MGMRNNSMANINITEKAKGRQMKREEKQRKRKYRQDKKKTREINQVKEMDKSRRNKTMQRRINSLILCKLYWKNIHIHTHIHTQTLRSMFGKSSNDGIKEGIKEENNTNN